MGAASLGLAVQAEDGGPEDAGEEGGEEDDGEEEEFEGVSDVVVGMLKAVAQATLMARRAVHSQPRQEEELSRIGGGRVSRRIVVVPSWSRNLGRTGSVVRPTHCHVTEA